MVFTGRQLARLLAGRQLSRVVDDVLTRVPADFRDWRILYDKSIGRDLRGPRYQRYTGLQRGPLYYVQWNGL